MSLAAILNIETPAWMDRALCAQVGGDGWFPDRGLTGDPADNAMSVFEAKQVCGRCPVRARCLEYALQNDERFGVWGGLSENERRRVRAEHMEVIDVREVSA
jgi:WhiB family redox-sensing transcriptional regulator